MIIRFLISSNMHSLLSWQSLVLVYDSEEDMENEEIPVVDFIR